MALILNIETSTEVCSVALSKDSKIIALKETNEQKSHASLLTVFIQEILSEQKIKVVDLDAIAISKGPGSYTGLRIGVSTAKGLCYGADIPLISVGTLQAMSYGFVNSKTDLSSETNALFCPMIDARRMEVYTALYNYKNEIIADVYAKIIDEKSFDEELKKNEIYFFGDGANKCSTIITDKNCNFITDFLPSAKYLVNIAEQKFRDKDFEDIAYFEPFYLKNFIATTPKKLL